MTGEPLKLPEQLTLRDYFAAKALALLITSTHMWKDREDEDLANSAYAIADAMLEVRVK